MIPPTQEFLDSLKDQNKLYKTTSSGNWTVVFAKDQLHAETITKSVFGWNDVKVLDITEEDFNTYVNVQKATIVNLDGEFNILGLKGGENK